MVCSWQKGVISTGTGNPGPNPSHNLDSSTVDECRFSCIDFVHKKLNTSRMRGKSLFSFCICEKIHSFAKAVGYQERILRTNDDEFVGHDFDHFFSKQSTASSLDKVQVRIDLIGSVNCNIQLRVGVEGDERNVEAQGLFLGTFRGRDGNDIFEFSGFQKISNPFNGVVCRGTSSEANDHATLDVVIDGLVTDLFLEFLLRCDHSESRRLNGGM